MRNDITDLKKLTQELIEGEEAGDKVQNTKVLIDKLYGEENKRESMNSSLEIIPKSKTETFQGDAILDNFDDAETVEETVSLQEKEFEMIKQALERNKGKRKLAAQELGISERTLYRKIKQYDL